MNLWKNPSALVIFIILLLIIVGVVFYLLKSQEEDAKYNPAVNPADFVSEINNKYLTLKPGTKFTYEKKTNEGLERVEVLVTRETKKVMNITATVVRDKVWLNNQLVEDTRDWFAQDKNGDVWYFGEEVDNYENGMLKDHAGSWEAGIDGAKPGIVMLADPKVGDSYRQEFYQGKAEDVAEVLSLDETVTVPYGTLENCLKTYDWTPLDPEAKEHKYYCPQVGSLGLEMNLLDGVKSELINVQKEK